MNQEWNGASQSKLSRMLHRQECTIRVSPSWSLGKPKLLTGRCSSPSFADGQPLGAAILYWWASVSRFDAGDTIDIHDSECTSQLAQEKHDTIPAAKRDDADVMYRVFLVSRTIRRGVHMNLLPQ